MLQQNNPDTKFCTIPMGDGKTVLTDQKGKINRMVILAADSKLSSRELVGELHMTGNVINVRLTCYGANVNGFPDEVNGAIESVRKMDPDHIFVKSRGFPPGDPRRCRARRGGARDGFHQLEAEYKLLDQVGKALSDPKHVDISRPEKVPVSLFKKIVENEEE